MPDPNAHLTMRLSPVVSNMEPYRYMSLVIVDITSGRRIAEFELLPEHLMELLSSSQIGGVSGIPAWLIEPEDRHALGKNSFTTQRRFNVHKHNDDTVRRWAQKNSAAAGAHTFRVSKNNASQIVVTFVFYTEHAGQELDVTQSTKQATMDHVAPPASDR